MDQWKGQIKIRAKIVRYNIYQIKPYEKMMFKMTIRDYILFNSAHMYIYMLVKVIIIQ